MEAHQGMVGVITVILFSVISLILTIWVTHYYVKHYKEISIGYPIALLSIFTLLVIFNAFPVLPTLLGNKFATFWADVSNGGYAVELKYKYLTPIGLILLTLKLYCTSNIVILLFYVLIELIKKLTETKKVDSKKLKADAVSSRKGTTSSRDDLPIVGEDFSFVTDAMPVNGIMVIDGIKIEILNNSGKKIPEGKKRIYARRIKDHQQLDSKTTDAQPEGDIPYIEIWSVEKI